MTTNYYGVMCIGSEKIFFVKARNSGGVIAPGEHMEPPYF